MPVAIMTHGKNFALTTATLPLTLFMTLTVLVILQDKLPDYMVGGPSMAGAS